MTLTADGLHLWHELATPKIRAYYEQALAGFSVEDVSHALHYLVKILDNMAAIDAASEAHTAG